MGSSARAAARGGGSARVRRRRSARARAGARARPRMPDEDCDENGDENDDHDTERCRAATVPVFHYYWPLSHTSSCSFQSQCARYTHTRQAVNHKKRMAVIMWGPIGFAFAVAMGIFAFNRSRRAPSNYYESDVYGMTPALHRRYAIVALIFALAFAASFVSGMPPAVPVLGAFAVVLIFYFSSFFRGFSDEL